MTVPLIDEDRLDQPDQLRSADPADMLAAVASAAPQVRAAVTRAEEAGLARLAEGGRPRAVVVAGMGGSGSAGDVLAVAAPTSPVPLLTHRGPGLPAWVGATDLVAAVSCSGSTAETLSAAAEAARRGARLLGVGADPSPLAELVARGGGSFVPVTTGGRPPRANLWALAVPLLVAVRQLGLADLPPAVLERAALRLEEVARRCRPDVETFVNPAKTLAVQLAGTLPLIWGTGPVGAVAAYRFACDLAENADYPGVYGAFPEAAHNQVVTLDGPFATPAGAVDVLFRDRVSEPAPLRLRLVLLRDAVEGEPMAGQAAAVAELAGDRGVAVSELHAEGEHPVERLATLVGITTHASVYLALLYGVDPAATRPIAELKRRLARR